MDNTIPSTEEVMKRYKKEIKLLEDGRARFMRGEITAKQLDEIGKSTDAYTKELNRKLKEAEKALREPKQGVT